MAKLQSRDLTLEIKFQGFEDEWVIYEIKFYWKDKTIVNDSILKKRNRAFFANDYQNAIYPGIFFPFLKSHWTLVEENNDKIKPEEERDTEKQETSEQLDDFFTIIAFIDSYNFKKSGAYSGQGISLHLTVERNVLEKFVTELEKEYRDSGAEI